MRLAAHRDVGIGGVANLNREQCDIVAEVGTAKLDVRGAVASRAADRRPAGDRGKSGFTRTVEKNEALHEFDTRRRGEARKRFGVACSQELFETSFVVSAGGGQEIAEGGGGRVGRRRGAWRWCGVSPGTRFLSQGAIRDACKGQRKNTEQRTARGHGNFCSAAAAARICGSCMENLERGMTSSKPADCAFAARSV